MPDKKIVDDYYASVPSEGSSETEAKKAPIKIKAKKISVKVKKADVKTDTPVETPAVSDQPIDEGEIKTEVQKVEAKKETKNTPYKPKMTVVRRSSESHEPYKKPESNTATLSTPRKTAAPKKFHDDKPAANKSNDFSRQKKSSLSPYQGKRARGKLHSIDEGDGSFKRSNKLMKKKKEEKKIEDIKQNLVDRTGQTVVIADTLSLKELSDKLGIALVTLIAEFMKNGLMVNINSPVDFESASIVAEAFDIKLQRDNSAGMDVSEVLEGDLEKLLSEDDSSKLIPRPPVISIMGHVDHGKTSLLDYIRQSKVAAGEAGGITQSIGAYQVEKNDQKITFLDTPGHEAFTVMRARGAKSTDIAILVVAANEGVKPQTIESINHAKEAGIPIVVAINKMDLDGANPDHVKGQLAEHGLTPEDWGGETPMIPVSAHTGFGVDDLLEMILLVAEMKEMTANPDRAAVATVIESHLDPNLGPVATLLINAGTLGKGDDIVCKDALGKVKVMKNHLGVGVKTALPGDPVLIVGLDKVIGGGDILQAVSSVAIARKKVADYEEIARANKALASSGIDLLMSKIKAGSLKQLKIVLKADSNGSLEAIKASLTRLSSEETTVSIIHSGVGDISQSDAIMAESSQAVLIGFSVGILGTAKKIVEDSKLEYIGSPIIYHITERIEKIVTGMLDPKEIEVHMADAKVLAIFYTSKEFMVAGVHVPYEHKIIPDTLVRVLRKKELVGKGKITLVKKGVEEVHEVEGETECGIRFEGNITLQESDMLEIYQVQIEK